MIRKLGPCRTEAIGGDLSALEAITPRRDWGHGTFDGGLYDGCGWKDPEPAFAGGAQLLSSRAVSVETFFAVAFILINPRVIQLLNSR